MKPPLRSILSLSVLIFVVLTFTQPAFSQEKLKEALYYHKLDAKAVQCQLCPRKCVIPEGKRGFCGVRENRGGILYSLSYGKAVSVNDRDPIEKKPLFHFLPGTRTFSIATAGCNLRCKFCQNWEISQKLPEEVEYTCLEPQELVDKAKESGCPTIAYTYTEPTIFYEYMLETARLAHEEGLRSIMHSNGYINEESLRQLAKFLDAANIDLKGFTDDFYSRFTEGSVGPVLNSLKVLKQEGVHTEITCLILAGFNDDSENITKMCRWIMDNLGPDTPLHFSRAFPLYKLTSINPTPIETLERARKIAMDCGLRYVYIGNVAGNPAENTYCPKCKKMIIQRRAIFLLSDDIVDGKCKFCAQEIYGVWK